MTEGQFKVGDVVVTTREIKQGVGTETLFPEGIAVRVDKVGTVGMYVHSVERRHGFVEPDMVRPTMPEDDEVTSVFEPLDDDPAVAAAFRRISFAEKAAGILRARSVLNVTSVDPVQVIVLATYLENGITEESAKALAAALESYATPPRYVVAGDPGTPQPRAAAQDGAEDSVRWLERLAQQIGGAARRPANRGSNAPLVVQAGALLPGDATDHWTVLSVAPDGQNFVSVWVANTEPESHEKRFSKLVLVKSTPVDVTSRLVDLSDLD